MELRHIIGILISLLLIGNARSAGTGNPCLLDSYVLSPNSMYGFNATNVSAVYPQTEAFLQVYKQLVVPCDGWIKAVFFYPAHDLIKSVNIANFRVDQSDKFLQLVNTTSIRNVVTPRGLNGWIYYDLPNQIYAKSGDYIGIYYDNWRTEAADLVIRSVDISIDPIIAYHVTDDTLVFRADGRSLGAGTGLDTNLADVRRRLPALSVLISSVPPTTTPLPTTPSGNILPRQCTMQMLPDDLNCANTTLRYRYSPTERRCFDFLGCDTMATSNNFPTATSCAAFCILPYATTTTVKPANGSVQTDQKCMMTLTTDDTNCATLTERWNYNPIYQQCRPFLGCIISGGIGNNWDSEYLCEVSCRVGNSTESAATARCSSDSTLGQWLCLSKEPRFYWNADSSSCEVFYGCPYRDRMGFQIGNNFGSKMSCVSACATKITP